MLRILNLVQRVAATDTSVLVLGESGTGKELIAQSIHQLSKRSKGPLVTVNCTALPAALIESELFGHEKGAFTGATDKRIGKFERAAGGTIFLDEIGEMPFDLQSKLLRVLQEKEIERVGGSNTIRTDVRIIAATNRNPEQEVAEGRFRMDLYYRLNVFPIQLPPLRERKDDLLLLAEHFLEIFSTSLDKNVVLSSYAKEQLLQYNWPGNIRELQNLIERSVLLCTKSVITSVILPANGIKEIKQSVAATYEDNKIKSMEETERDHIVAALKACNGKIAGWNGAAKLLKMNSSTLNSRIKKLKIIQNDNMNQ
jgi:transcriptional regulator with GAF, ATPase, and Fis domain